MFDVISIGSATLDVFIRSKGLEIEREGGVKDICVRYGAKIPVDELYFESGGGGTNTAVTFSRQGLKVASIVKLADDFSGKKIKEDLEKEGVDIQYLVTEVGGTTDYSTILWAPDGGRTILVYRGKTKVEVDEVPWKKLEAKWFYISSVEGNLEIISNILLRQAQDDTEQNRSIKYPISNIKVAWNPGGEELKQKEKVLSLLPGITLLNLNKEEMGELIGPPSPSGSEGFGGAREIGELLKKAQELPCEYVVITDDKNGSYMHQKGESFWWHGGIFGELPRIETTGAGDAFGSGLVTGLIKGFSIENCIKLATANAGSKITQVGAKKGLLRAEDTEKWLAKSILLEKINI